MKKKWRLSLFKSKWTKTNYLFILKIALLLNVLTINNLLAQQQIVTGTVTDASNGELLPGVNIIIEGTSLGTISDLNGKYKIEISNPDVTLTYSFIGYLPEKVPYTGQSVLDVKLSPDITALDEVVVVGYGTVKKRDLTGPVSSIKGAQVAAIPVSDVTQALQGRLAGVNVVSQDGRPDADVSVRIRGGGSITGDNQPLYIVDGFPSSISSIPANMIESIDVLKDASTTAIYGASGANGVIIVTTKSGKSGKMKVSYDGFYKINTPTSYMETMNAYDYIAYNWAYAAAIDGPNANTLNAYANGWEWLWGIGRHAADADINNTDGINHYRNIAAPNYSKEVYFQSTTQSHNLTLSGGNENTNFIIGVNRLDDDGMKINSWYKRTNASLKLEQKLSKKLSFTLNTKFSYINKMGNEGTTNGAGSVLSSSYWFRPIATSDVLGQLNDQQNTFISMYDKSLQDIYNPVALTKDYYPESKERNLVANTGLNWKLIKGLIARSEASISANWNKNNTWSGAVYNNYLDNAGNKTYGGNAEVTSKEGWGLRLSNTLTYELQLGTEHSLSVMGGQEVTNSGNSESMTMKGSKFPKNYTSDKAYAMMGNYYKPSSTTSPLVPGSIYAESPYTFIDFSSSFGTPSHKFSLFGRTNYSFRERYLLTATFRADASSNFGPNHKWGYFPAGAIAWRISEEKFIKDNAAWIDQIKLRFSYGIVGNDKIDQGLYWQSYKTGPLTTWSIGETPQPTYIYSSTTKANPDIRWEETTTRNLGLDYGFFKNRINGSIEVYKNTTNNVLGLLPIKSTEGFLNQVANVGNTQNKGVEITLGSDIVRSKDFNLNVSININFNNGKITSINPDTVYYKTQWGSTGTQPTSGDYMLAEGQPVGLVRGYIYDGWYTVDDFTYANGIYTLKPGIPDIATGILGPVKGTDSNKPSGQTAYPGVMKLRNINDSDTASTNHVPVINEKDAGTIGNMNPKHTGGFTIQGNYKNLDFSLGFNWNYGNQIYNANYLAAFTGAKEDGLFKNRLNILSSAYKMYDIQGGQLVKVTDPTELNALNANSTTFLPYNENPVVSTLGIEDGSYLRLNTVTFGYTLPSKFLHFIKMNKLRLYATVYNAFIWTKYKGMDPEVNTNTHLGSATYPTPGLDFGSYPRARSYIFGLNIEF